MGGSPDVLARKPLRSLLSGQTCLLDYSKAVQIENIKYFNVLTKQSWSEDVGEWAEAREWVTHTLTLLLWLCSIQLSQRQVRRMRRRRAASLRAYQYDQNQHGVEWYCITRACSLQQGSKRSCIKYERRKVIPLCISAEHVQLSGGVTV